MRFRQKIIGNNTQTTSVFSAGQCIENMEEIN